MQRALKQIEEKNYIQSILDAGVPREQIRCYGFGFHGREVLVWDGKEPLADKAKAGEQKKTRKKTPSLIQKQPTDISGEKGTILTLSLKGRGEDISYQWLYQEEGDDTWKKTRIKGCKTSALQVTGTAANEKKRFKCLLEDTKGHKQESKVVRILLKEKREA